MKKYPGRRPVIAAGLVAAALAVSATSGCASSPARPAAQPAVPSGSAAPTAAPKSPQPGITSPTPPSPSVTSPPAASSPAPPPSTPPSAPGTLRPGSGGPAVLALQRELTSLGYWLGTPDGIYSELTEQAVVALQKAAGLPRDGVYGPLTARALARGIRPAPRSGSGHVAEIDLGRQLLLLVTNGHVGTVLDTSTGSGASYFLNGQAYLAVTPAGIYHVFRQVDGSDRSPLGVLWRPKYFNGGIAIHGYPDVPPYPASHGCVRISNAAIDWIWASDLVPIGTTVLVY